MDGLDRLLHPRTIAVIGGGTWCANVIAQCRKIGFEGAIWPVHPTRAEMGGLATFPDVAALPDAPDAAYVGVNRAATIDVVAALSARGTGGAICFASGFREAQSETGDGASLQEALLTAAGKMTVLGPNCYGVLNYLDGVALWPDQHGGQRADKGVALITQSSNIAINLTMQTKGLPLSYVVTVGNQAQTGLSQIASALIRDDRVTALGLYIEGIGDLRAFETMAEQARIAGTPVVALKIGRSDHARMATVSHTASLTGSDTGASALFQRLGFGEVRSLPALLETLKLLHVTGPLSSNRIASLSCSGGEASLMADSAIGSGVVFPPLSDAQTKALRHALGPKVALANPLDYHTYIWEDLDAMTACYSAMMQGDLALGCVVADFPRADRCDPSAWDPVIRAVAATRDTTGRPMAILSTLPETMPEETAARLIALGIPPLTGIDDALTALSVAADLGRTRAAPHPLLVPPVPSPGQTLTEATAKAQLVKAGIPVPRAEPANTPEAAAEAARRIGFPIVLKADGLAHKTEAGGVVLNLTTAAAVTEAAGAMPVDRFLVEAMIPDGIAELLIGVIADPAHGYVLTLAAGGTLTELLDDKTALLIPATRADIRDALTGLRIAPLLTGYRGKPGVNMDAIVDVVMALQNYVAQTHPQEIEINPLICTPTQAVAADALIRTGDLT